MENEIRDVGYLVDEMLVNVATPELISHLQSQRASGDLKRAALAIKRLQEIEACKQTIYGNLRDLKSILEWSEDGLSRVEGFSRVYCPTFLKPGI